jgi:hypothetical protein
MMQLLSKISRLVGDDLRKAERSINLATRDTAQFLLTTLDATESLSLSPAMAQRTVRATVATLSALVDGQDQMAMKAHFLIEKVGRQLGLTETNWGVGAPKPKVAAEGVDESMPA